MANRSHRATVIDVAREAGVSKSSAARVLAGRGSASRATQERVLAAAERLGYRPNGLARAMISGTTTTIGVVIPDVANPFFSAVVRGVSDAAHAAGFEVVLGNTDNDRDIQSRSIDVLREKQVDGFVIAPVFEEHPESVRALIDDGIPVALVDRRMPALADVPLVSIDNIAAARGAMDHLLDLGHRRVAILTEAASRFEALLDSDADTQLMRPSDQRLLGYVEALRSRGMDADPELVVGAAYDSEAASVALAQAIGRTEFSALFCTDSTLTLGAYAHVAASGMTLPDDLSFVGFDDQDWTTLVRPSITVVDQPRYRLGAATANLLLARIQGVQQTQADMILEAELVVRGSTAARS